MWRTPIQRTVVLLVSWVALMGAPALAQGDDPVLVELGSTRERASFILERFEIAVRGLAASEGQVYGPELLAELYAFLPQFLEQRAGELVLLEEARRRGVSVDEEAVEAVIDGLRERFPDEGAFDEVLASAGFRDVDHLRSLVRESERIEALVGEFESEVELTELEVRVAYEALKPQLMRPEQVCARHILVDSEVSAGVLARSARAGADFASMAQTASTDRGSAERGGDLGCFGRGSMVAPFEEAAFNAELGVATDPVESQFGFHVLLVYDKVPAQVAALEEVREPLEQQLRGERVQSTIAAYQRVAGVRTYPERIPAPPTVEETAPND
jgi:parvulin-like peptidyl-prolyl isomerase